MKPKKKILKNKKKTNRKVSVLKSLCNVTNATRQHTNPQQHNIESPPPPLQLRLNQNEFHKKSKFFFFITAKQILMKKKISDNVGYSSILSTSYLNLISVKWNSDIKE